MMPTALMPGESLAGRYRIEAEIGRGPLSTVYRATDLRLGVEVALKVAEWGLPKHDGPPPARLLRHRNVVTLRDVLPLSGSRTGIVMDLVHGSHLRALMREGPLSEEWTRFLMEHVARGLAHAHGSGVVHGDVRPENVVLLSGDGPIEGVKLAGFEQSLALALGASPAGPANRLSAYAAPEQRHGGQVGPPADIYALGATMWEVATGAAHRSTAGAQAAASLSPELEAILRKCVSPLPAERYADAGELLLALRGPERAAVAVAAAASPGSRRGVAILAGALAALAMVAVALLLVWQLGGLWTTGGAVASADVPAPSALSGAAGGGPVPEDAGPVEPDRPLEAHDEVEDGALDDGVVEAAPGGSSGPAGEPASAAAESPPEPTSAASTSSSSSRRSARASSRKRRAPATPVSPKPSATGKRTATSGISAPASGTSEPSRPASNRSSTASAGGAEAAGGEPAPADPTVRALAGVSTWVGEVGGRPAKMRLDVAADGSATGVVSARIGADTHTRSVEGTIGVSRDGKLVVDLRETQRSRRARYVGSIVEGVGAGEVSINGRERAAWSMRRE